MSVLKDTSVHALGWEDAKILNFQVQTIHRNAREAGWWNDPATGFPYSPTSQPFLVPAKLALIHSEVSEAVEGHRKGKMDDHLPERKCVEVELADAVIRIFDLAGFLGLDLGGAIVDKVKYNQSRADHKVENRLKEGGKAY